MKKVFIDSDVILDLLQDQSPFNKESVKIFTLIENGKLKGFVSPLIFSNIFYILRKYQNAKFATSSLLRLKSSTSGKAGGLKDWNRSKRVRL